MIENVPPDFRFLFKNSVILGVIKGPSELMRMDTFFIPLVREVGGMNGEGGASFGFGDGGVRKIQVHTMFMNGDALPVDKMSCMTGMSGLYPCWI